MGYAGSLLLAVVDELSSSSIGLFPFFFCSKRSSFEKWLSRSMMSTRGSDLGSSEMEGIVGLLVFQGCEFMELRPLVAALKHLFVA